MSALTGVTVEPVKTSRDVAKRIDFMAKPIEGSADAMTDSHSCLVQMSTINSPVAKSPNPSAKYFFPDTSGLSIKL